MSKLFRPSWKSAQKWIAIALGAMLMILPCSTALGSLQTHAETVSVSGTQFELPSGRDIPSSPPHDGWLFRMAPASGRVMAMQVMLPESAHALSSLPNWFHVETRAELDEIIASGMVDAVEENLIVTLFEDPVSQTIDPYFTQYQSAYMSLIKQQAAWNAGLDGSGVKIAIIDSGLIPNHEDIDYLRVLPGTNYSGSGTTTDTADSTGHGSFVTSLISGQTGNGIGMAGVADGASILPLRAFSSTSASVASIISAIGEAIAQDADIINMSFGMNTDSEALSNALDPAIQANILLVAAVGNDALIGNPVKYPAAYDEVIGVGAVKSDGTIASFSEYNSSVFVSAPGDAVLGISYLERSSYLTGSGTSYATPIVVGMLALAKQLEPTLTIQQTKNLLSGWVTDAGTEGYDLYYGYGIIDVSKMVEQMLARTTTYTITYHENGGTLPDAAFVPTEFTELSADIVLPVPTLTGYAFGGWYKNADLTGTPLFVLPTGTKENTTLYAGWTMVGATDSSLLAISVKGLPATPVEGMEASYTVNLPQGTDLTTILPEDIVITPTSMHAHVLGLQKNMAGTEWTFQILAGNNTSFTDYTLQTTANAAPSVRSGQLTQTGVATPAALDAVITANPYTADLSAWFQDDNAQPLTYVLVSHDATSLPVFSGNTFTFTPAAADAGKTRTFIVKANDGMYDSTGQVTLTIVIGDLPLSRSTLASPTGVYDLNPYAVSHTAVDVGMNLFGNELYGVSLLIPAEEGVGDARSVPLNPLTDFLSSDILHGNGSTTHTLTLLPEWLDTLAVGEHELAVAFNAGEAALYQLTVMDTYVAITNISNLPDTMTVGTPKSLSGTVEPANATRKTIAWSVYDANGTGAVVSGNTLTATAAGTATLRATISGGIPEGAYQQDFVITVQAAPIIVPGTGGGGGSVAPPAPPAPPPAPPPPPPPLPPAPIAPTEEELVLFSAGEPVTLAYTQADGVVSMNPQEDSLVKLLDGTGSVSPLELNFTGVVGAESVVLPSGMLSTLARSATPGGINGIRLALPEGSVTLDATALRGLSGRVAAQPLAVSIRRLQASALSPAQQAQVGSQPVFDLSVSLGGTAIHTFTGQITFSLPYLLQPGQQGSGVVIWYLAEDGQLAPLPATYNSVTRWVTFTAPHLSLFAIGYDPLLTWKNPFSDVSASGWYHDAIRHVHYHGLFSGTAPTNFSPQADMNRAMFVTVLWRMASAPTLAEPNKAASFLDVPSGQWYSQAVSWAVQAGVAGGVGDGRFAPENPVTREQIAVMMYQYAQAQGSVQPASVIPAFYADTASISTWARTAMQWAVAEGLITGKSGSRLDPGGKATRAEVAAILMRYMKH